MLVGRKYKVVVSVFIGLVLSLLFCSCQMVFSEESLPTGLESLKVDVSFTELLFIMVAIEELYPFVFKKSGSLSHHAYNIYKKFRR